MMFVSPRHLRRGVEEALLSHAEHPARESESSNLTADVSITAQPFVERSDFIVEAEQQSVINGVVLTNIETSKKP